MLSSKFLTLTLATVTTFGLVGCSTSNVAATGDTSDTSSSASVETASASGGSANAASDIQYFADNNIAIRGADPVAYFTDNGHVPGNSEFTHEWQGVTWQFASAENRDTFAADPEAYAPQYGGFCAWAVSQGYTAEIDPEAWKIVDGKLYLNYNQKVQARWSKDIPGNIAKANKNWPGVLSKG